MHSNMAQAANFSQSYDTDTTSLDPKDLEVQTMTQLAKFSHANNTHLPTAQDFVNICSGNEMVHTKSLDTNEFEMQNMVQATNFSQSHNMSRIPGAQEIVQIYWEKLMEDIRSLRPTDLKAHQFPLKRVKKIMKSTWKYHIIGPATTALVTKAAEIFITEFTLTAWMNTKYYRRNTLMMADIAKATAESDHYDFLIDIVPRNRLLKRQEFQLELVNFAVPQVASANAQPIALVPSETQAVLAQDSNFLIENSEQRLEQLQEPVTENEVNQDGGGIQIVQEIIGNNGEIYQIPIQIDPNLLQFIQMQGQDENQSIIYATSEHSNICPVQQTEIQESDENTWNGQNSCEPYEQFSQMVYATQEQLAHPSDQVATPVF